MTAATDVWTKPEDLTDAHNALRAKAKWKCLETLPDGSMKAVDTLTGSMGNFNRTVVELQELTISDVIEVREGPTREEDVVIIYRAV